jgi:hypothetical protein
VAHNAFGLPLAQKVKFSENDQLLDLGDGLWNVTTDIGTYKLYVSDLQSVIEEERQLAFGFFMFNHPGDITWIKNADGTRHEMGAAATRPFSVDVAELFRIKEGQIRKVEALMVSLPYGQKNPYVPQQ